MKIFDAILADSTLDVPMEERVSVLGAWLKKYYGISVKDSNVLSDIVVVHDHGGGGEVHMGHPEVSSIFGSAVVTIVRAKDGWHVAFKGPEDDGLNLVHPKSESSWGHPVNRRMLGTLKTVLSQGSVREEVYIPAGSVMVDSPTAVFVPGGGVDLIMPAVPDPMDVGGERFDDLGSGVGLLGAGSSSVNVDLSAFMDEGGK